MTVIERMARAIILRKFPNFPNPGPNISLTHPTLWQAKEIETATEDAKAALLVLLEKLPEPIADAGWDALEPDEAANTQDVFHAMIKAILSEAE